MKDKRTILIKRKANYDCSLSITGFKNHEKCQKVIANRFLQQYFGYFSTQEHDRYDMPGLKFAINNNITLH